MATVKLSHPNPLSIEDAKKKINDVFSTYSATPSRSMSR
jgi:hypothetical protein